MLSNAPESLSRGQRYLMDPTRGICLPEDYGFADGFDRHGRPQLVNLQTVSAFYKGDILAHDRLMFPETSKRMPLFNFQRIMFREFMLRQFLWIQMMRGGGKTSTLARMILDYCLMNAGVPAVLTGPSFRQSLLMFDEMVKILELEKKNANSRIQVNAELKCDPTRNTMGATIQFKNGSTVKAIPMGDGSKIRGLRGGVLVIDEAYQVTEEMYESHIMPFLQVKQGGMESKVVFITTSWYQDCFAWARLCSIASEVKAGNPAYGILDFNLDDLITCGFPLSENIHRDARKHGNPLTYAMTYYNLWPSSSFRWYEQKVIDEALSAEHEVRVELERPKGDNSVYFGIVDLAASEKGDSTFITVGKYINGGVDYVYAVSGKGLGPHERAWLAHEAERKFNLAFMIYDAHGAIGSDFRDTMSKDKLLVDGKVKTVEPCVHIDDFGLKGKKLLIPVSSKHPAVIRALTGMPKDGRIEGEDGLNALLHTKCRDLLWDGKIRGPFIDGARYEDGQDYSGSEIEVADTIRTAFNQLAEVGLAKDLNGNQMYTKTQQLVFRTKSGAHDDGAMCIVYGTIGLLRLLDGGHPNDTRSKPFAQRMGEQQPFTPTRPINVQKITWA